MWVILPKIQFDAIENILNALKAPKNLFPNLYRVLTTYGSHCGTDTPTP